MMMMKLRFFRFVARKSNNENAACAPFPLARADEPSTRSAQNPSKMSLSYDLAMQGYFGLYAATMSAVPDLCVPGERVFRNANCIRAKPSRAHANCRFRRATPGD